MKKVLIQDTGNSNRESLAAVLKEQYDLTVCGQDALLTYLLNSPDDIAAVILDFHSYPNHSPSILHAVNSNPRLFHIAVAADIGSGEKRFEQEALQSGITVLIRSPYDPDIISLQIENAIKNASNQAQFLHRFDQTKRRFHAALSNVECGFVVLRFTPDGSVKLDYLNDFMCRMLGPAIQDILQMASQDVFTIIHPDDRDPIKQCLLKAQTNDSTTFSELCRIGLDIPYIWVQLNGNAEKNHLGETIFYCACSDITKEKDAQEKILFRDAAVDIAAEQTGIVFWTLDLQTQTVIYDNTVQTIYRDKGRIHRWHNKHLVHPEDLDNATAYFKRIFSGYPAPPIEIRLKNENTGEYYWQKITHTLLPDENGCVIKAIGSSIDITERKRLEEAFNEQMSFRNIVEQNVASYCRMNLSQNRLGPGIAPSKDMDYLLIFNTVDEFFNSIYPFIPDTLQKQSYQALFSRTSMIESFLAGKHHLQLEHKSIVNNGLTEWVETHANIMKNPKTGDIEALLYTFDTDNRKVTQLLFDKVVNSEYDYLSTIDIPNDIYKMYSHNPHATSIPDACGSFRRIYTTTAEKQISESTKDDYLYHLDPVNILNELETSEQFSFNFETIERDGSIRTRKMQLSYLDRDAKILCVTRRDITDILAEEQRKTEILKDALDAARQASTAKSDFLSRMSHEIRTPMNAIIGMTTIASQCIGDDKQVSDCLAKIGISSRFLLTLINDILDMSRIESGKVLLKNEKIPFEEFINGVNSICYTQAQAKDIDYESIVDAHLDDYYIGDAMKLQQILINILSNAVKFTPPGGSVNFRVREKKRMKENAVLEFVINDTGCGMSDDFIPKLYEPFAQEHAGGINVYAGTGLGMAICKNFVDLMDGQIQVRSMLGIGTEFVVNVKLGITNESKLKRASKQPYNFSNLTSLVVDDDVAVCEQAVITLHEIGIKADWVDSGRHAIELVQKKWEAKQYFDLILIDWKMPELDGIETARRIRSIVGPDVTIIIITAYDWSSIEQEAKKAGVNMLVSKPLFKSSLVSAFQKAFDLKEEAAAVAEQIFDFTGKRVLLAEDHPMNAEIATFLLEDKGMQVDHAENGIKAVEMFTLSAPGYYDAILMDIRMPYMDGLQATVSIRHLDKKDAKTIPIIAMTADAFEEDVTKAKQAGMNAHLAKPIDPKDLFTTLYHYLFEQ